MHLSFGSLSVQWLKYLNGKISTQIKNFTNNSRTSKIKIKLKVSYQINNSFISKNQRHSDTLRIVSEGIRHKTKIVKQYIPNDDFKNYPFCRFKLLVEKVLV